MKFLYFSWGENTADDMIQTLLTLGHNVCKMQADIPDYLCSPPLSAKIDAELKSGAYDAIFSFNYIPILSEAAQTRQVSYIAWIYDCPHWTLYSSTLTNKCNYLFLFDRNMTDKVKSLGAQHAYHLPLACNTARIHKLLGRQNEKILQAYENDVSFVGSLYEQNQYNQICYLPESLRGYLDGIMAAQKQIWGMNLISELLTPETIHSLQTYVQAETQPSCPIPAKDLFQDMLLAKITSDERIHYIRTLAKLFHVSLYSASSARLCPNAANKGTLSYTKEMPIAFHKTKINLNITLRSITSGIPLRALDIMGCTGFLLTNYQQELCEYFEPDREFVYYENLDDLIQKTDYYLQHENERMQIAQAGYKKVQELFSYHKQVKNMLRYV